MKRAFSLLFVSLAVMLGLSMTAFAQTTITFGSASGTNYGGVYTGVYNGTLTTTTTAGSTTTPELFICDDAKDEISNGQWWSANVFPLSDVGTAGNGFFSGSPSPYTATADGIITSPPYTPQQIYNSVAWLADQIFRDPTGPNVNAQQYAIWDLMAGPSLPWTGPSNTGSWITWGLNHDTYSSPKLFFATPLTTGAQEFVWDPTPPTVTPEPLSMVLMGTFLSLAAVLMGRKKLAS